MSIAWRETRVLPSNSLLEQQLRSTIGFVDRTNRNFRSSLSRAARPSQPSHLLVAIDIVIADRRRFERMASDVHRIVPSRPMTCAETSVHSSGKIGGSSLTPLPHRKPASAPKRSQMIVDFATKPPLSRWRSRAELVVQAMNSMACHFSSFPLLSAAGRLAQG